MNTKLALVLAITLGFIAAIGVHMWIKTEKIRQLDEAEPLSILSTRQKVKRGTVLKEKNCRAILIPKNFVTRGMIPYNERYRFYDKTANRDLDPGRPIFEDFLTNVKDRSSLARIAVQEGRRAVTIRVDNVSGVAGLIRPGDYVDVVLTGGRDANMNSQTRRVHDSKSYYLVQAARVLAIDNQIVKADESRFDRRMYRTVTVELKPDDALRLINAQNNRTGIRLQLMLRNPAETAVTEGVQVEQDATQRPTKYWDISNELESLQPAE